MHQHRLELSPLRDQRQERLDRIRYFGFAAVVGVFLLLNLTGVFRSILGVDTAAILTILAGYRTFYNAIHGLLEKTISADLAICIAVIAALSVGEYLAAAEAMFIMLIGEGLEGYATRRTSAAIQNFVEKLPRRARLLRPGPSGSLEEAAEVEVDAATLQPGDVIVVRAGERVAADGVVASGVSSVDESSITGESLPRDKQEGDEVFSGSLNGHGLLRIRVTRAGQDTTLARVIKLVEEARQRKAPVERLADRWAKYFVPALLLAGALTFYFTRDWLRTVAVLIVACPCALILATPTAVVAAMGGLARRGILVRGGTVLQESSRVDTFVFDKTGTVTEGRFEILRIAANGAPEEEILRLAAMAESGSDHVLARVIVDEARRRDIAFPQPETARVLPGRGAECSVNGRIVRAGNAAFLAENGIQGAQPFLEEADRLGATCVLVADGNQIAGAVLLRDRIRPGIREAVHELEHLGVTHQIMLTGDRRRAAEVIAREVGLSSVEAELLPEQKLDRIRALVAQGRVVAMAGDGVNDAPALAASNVGIAVAGASDLTAEAAGVVYMGQSLEKLPQLIEVSRRAVTIVWQNIIFFAVIVNIVAVGLASGGVLGPLGAAFTHQIGSFLVMLNSLRLLRAERRGRRWLHHPALTNLKHKFNLYASRIDPKETFFELWQRRRDYYRRLAVAGLAALVLSGFYQIQPDELGVIERFGRKIEPHRPAGLHYKLPWPVEKLTRVQARRIRVIEIGFRSDLDLSATEPVAYEWNVQHRAGRFVRKPEEALMLSGDQNLAEVSAVVHYRLTRPDEYLFQQFDGEATIRAAAEAALHSVIATTPLDDVLTVRRPDLEARARELLQQRLELYRAGAEVLHVKLLDVHPSVEVVDAYRGVSGAFEEKNRLINEAEAYRNEQVALARGRAAARILEAKSYSLGLRNRAAGDASRFVQSELAFRAAPGPTETRLYLETMEQILPGKNKMIVDSTKARRQLWLVEQGAGGFALPRGVNPASPQ